MKHNCKFDEPINGTILSKVHIVLFNYTPRVATTLWREVVDVALPDSPDMKRRP